MASHDNLVYQFKVMAKAYTQYKATLRDCTSRNMKKRIWNSARSTTDKSMYDLVERVRRHIYAPPETFDVDFAGHLLVIMNIGVRELGFLLKDVKNAESIKDAVLLVVDIGAYFEKAEAADDSVDEDES